MIMFCGAGLTGLIACLTSGGLRVLTVGPTASVAMTVWTYFDRRTRSRAAAQWG
ncbi:MULTISPECIES: hypothetical protein [Streptomyces]|uniref:Uncharacterized protein n=2 Tax=Streptomyces TaxID=1883 RepID=A0ABT9LRY2_STRGD|nr:MULTISPECIES: hypothetical protein [Streptomyces]MDP9686277.1 hypothetical protein [Streptomyces griseoviridis]